METKATSASAVIRSPQLGLCVINVVLHCQVYKRKNEAAKKDYLKAMAEYREGKISQVRPVVLSLKKMDKIQLVFCNCILFQLFLESFKKKK